jgi:hypothetical protein
VEAFMPGVLLRMAGLDEFRDDAELDPPDGECRQPGERGAGEGRPVIRPDAVR